MTELIEIPYIERLEAERDQLKAENERLRREARGIWQDGFESGESHGNLPYKYPPMVIAWLFSDTYENLEIEYTETHKALRVRWLNQTYDERESTEVLWKDSVIETPATPSEDE